MADDVAEVAAAPAADAGTSLTAAPDAAAAAAAAPEGDAAGQQTSDTGQGDAAAAAGQGTGNEETAAQAGDKPGDAAGGAEGAGDQGSADYTAFTMPDEFKLSDEQVGSLTTFAKAHKLDQTAAQALVDLSVAQHQAIVRDFAQEALAAPVPLASHWAQAWSQQTAKDAELGGDKLKATMTLASRVCATFATPALMNFLTETGLAHHPELVRFMHKVGDAVSEDTLVLPTGVTQGAKARDPASKLYPGMARAAH